MFWYILLGLAAYLVWKRVVNRHREPNLIGRPPQKRVAVVIGAGISGLFNAKILSKLFEKVIVLERDDIDFSKPTARKGASQSKQLHTVLNNCASISDQYFPGIIQQMRDAGAASYPFIGQIVGSLFGCYSPELASYRLFDPRSEKVSPITNIGVSRAMYEYHLRNRLLSDCPNVELKTSINVTGLIYNQETRVVEGVKYLVLKGEDYNETLSASREEILLRADFVVASPGRTNPIPKWFTAAGILKSEKDVESEFILPNVRYCSSIMRPPPGWLEKNPSWKPVAVGPFIDRPGGPSWEMSFVNVPQEHGGYAVLFGRYGNQPLPRDKEELLALFAKEGRDYKGATRIVTEWEQVTNWESWFEPKTIIYHYSRLESVWPDHFVVCGDGISTFNPAFGQGMTQAAMHAQVLERVFFEHFLTYPLHDFVGLSHKFQREAAVISNAFYQGNVPLDLDLPYAEGTRNLRTKLQVLMVKHVFFAACEDPAIYCELMKMTNRLQPPSGLLKWKVIRGVLLSLYKVYVQKQLPPVLPGPE